MAVAEIYSEGRGIFDAMPYIKAIEAKQKAKDVAVTNYFKDLNTKINTAGVRSQDIIDPKTGQGIKSDIDNWTNYYINNKDAITKGGASKIEFERMQRDILNRIEQSKSVAKMELELGKAKFEGKYDPDDDDLKVLERMGASIYNPYHYKEFVTNPAWTDNKGTEFSWNDISLAIPSLTTKEKDAFFKYSLGGAKLEIDPSTKTSIDPNNPIVYAKYTKEALKQGADRASFEVREDAVGLEQRKLKKYYNKLLKDKAYVANANVAFKEIYNRDISNISDLAAADFILAHKDIKDPKPLKTRQPRVGRSGGSKDDAIDENLYYITDQVAADAGVYMDITIKGKKERKKVVFLKDVDKDRMNIITGQDLTKGITAPTPLTLNVIQKDGSMKKEQAYIVDEDTGDWYGLNDQKISREAAKDRYIERKASTKVKIKAGTKAKETGPGQTTPKSRVAQKAATSGSNPKKTNDPLNLGIK